MFNRMPKVFWAAIAIMYGWFFLFFLLEITIPGFPLFKFLGIPASYLYNGIIGLWVLNIVVSWVLYRAEEAREEKVAAREAKAAAAGGVGSTAVKS